MFDNAIQKVIDGITAALSKMATDMLTSPLGILLLLVAVSLFIFPIARSIWRTSRYLFAAVLVLAIAAALFRPAMPKRDAPQAAQPTVAVEPPVNQEQSPLSKWLFGPGARPKSAFDIQCPGDSCGAQLHFEEPDRNKTAICNKCGLDIGRIGAVAESRIPAAGETVPVACRFCNARYPLLKGDGIAKAFTCRRCKKAQYISEAMLAYEATKGLAITISKGDWFGFQCLKCGAGCGGIQDENRGDFTEVECGRCGHPNPVTADKMIHRTARELEERRELVRHGIQPPDGFFLGEQRLFDEFLKTRPASPGDPYAQTSPKTEQRERWNAFQRSLPGVKRFINRDGGYGDAEPPATTDAERAADILAERMEIERMALSEMGIMTPTMSSPKEEEAYKAYEAKKIEIGFPGWEVQHNQKVAVINRWNELQMSVPEDRRNFLDKSGFRIVKQPGKFKMMPVNDEERLDEDIANSREILAYYEILFPDATPKERETFDRLQTPKNAKLLAEFRGDPKSKTNHIKSWNYYQGKLKPAKRTYYLTDQGVSTKEEQPGW